VNRDGVDFVEGVGDDGKVFLQLWPLITGNQSERISLVRGELEAGASRVVKRSQLRRLPLPSSALIERVSSGRQCIKCQSQSCATAAAPRRRANSESQTSAGNISNSNSGAKVCEQKNFICFGRRESRGSRRVEGGTSARKVIKRWKNSFLGQTKRQRFLPSSSTPNQPRSRQTSFHSLQLCLPSHPQERKHSHCRCRLFAAFAPQQIQMCLVWPEARETSR
jgi:hypothetical protein